MLTILFFTQCILHTVATDVMYFSCSALLCMHTSMIVIHSVLHVILGQAMRLLYSAKLVVVIVHVAGILSRLDYNPPSCVQLTLGACFHVVLESFWYTVP